MKPRQIVLAPVAALVAGAFALSACGVEYATTSSGGDQETTTKTATPTPKPSTADPDTDTAADPAAGDAAPWPAPDVPVVVETTRQAGWTDYLQAADHKPIYRFDNDANQPPTSSCEDECAKVWMPVPADQVTEVKGVDKALVASLERPDGTRQLTIKGWPTYTFAGDTKPGDLTGQGRDGLWFVMAPTGAKALTTDQAEKQKSGATVLTDTKLGAFTETILVDGDGRTMYRFDADEPNAGTSACESDDECDEKWPPVLADSGLDVVEDCVDPDLISTFTRKDGTKQVAVNGWPLYYYFEDKAPGDIKGHGVGDVWFAATADGGKAVPAGDN
jgi:predicted lipoprotein with Yx(FWY)xxD motif